MPSMGQPFGLTPTEINTLNLAMGAGHPPSYSAMGLMVSSMSRWTIKERMYRPRFLKACAKGLITFQDWGQLQRNFFDRLIVVTPKGIEAIRDLGVLFQTMDYNYLRNFDPYDLSPKNMDRYLDHKTTVQGAGRGQAARGRAAAFADHMANVRKDPKNFFWRG